MAAITWLLKVGMLLLWLSFGLIIRMQDLSVTSWLFVKTWNLGLDVILDSVACRVSPR